MSRKVTDNSNQNKSESSTEDKLRKHFTVKKLTGNPTEAQVRMMALHLWLMDVARDPEGKHIFLTLEGVAEEYGYDPKHYHEDAIKLFLLLSEE